MKPTKIQFDTDFEEDGLFSITFWFDKYKIPSYLSIAKDEMEDPDFVYIEAEDQKFGFKSADLTYSINAYGIKLTFAKESNSYFYWDKSKEIEIEINENDLENVKRYLGRICP